MRWPPLFVSEVGALARVRCVYDAVTMPRYSRPREVVVPNKGMWDGRAFIVLIPGEGVRAADPFEWLVQDREHFERLVGIGKVMSKKTRSPKQTHFINS